MGYIIAKTTAAVTSEAIDLTHGPFPKTIFVAGTLVAEEIDVYVVDTEPSTPVLAPLYDPDGAAVTLTVSSQPLTIPGPVWLSFDKPITANAVGIRLQEIEI